MASTWTQGQNKLFEKALALYDRETPDRWQNVANTVGKSVEGVKRHYEILKEDVERIEHGQVPYPHYRTNSNNNLMYWLQTEQAWQSRDGPDSMASRLIISINKYI